MQNLRPTFHEKFEASRLKCAWFDERDYFEFFPLTGVYPRPAVSILNA
jgi:hypothetical protein